MGGPEIAKMKLALDLNGKDSETVRSIADFALDALLAVNAVSGGGPENYHVVQHQYNELRGGWEWVSLAEGTNEFCRGYIAAGSEVPRCIAIGGEMLVYPEDRFGERIESR